MANSVSTYCASVKGAALRVVAMKGWRSATSQEARPLHFSIFAPVKVEKALYDRRLTKKVRRSKCKLRTCSDRNCDAGVGLGERMVEEARLGNSSGLLYSITKTTHVKNLQPRFSKTYLLIYKFAFFDLLGLEES